MAAHVCRRHFGGVVGRQPDNQLLAVRSGPDDTGDEKHLRADLHDGVHPGGRPVAVAGGFRPGVGYAGFALRWSLDDHYQHLRPGRVDGPAGMVTELLGGAGRHDSSRCCVGCGADADDGDAVALVSHQRPGDGGGHCSLWRQPGNRLHRVDRAAVDQPVRRRCVALHLVRAGRHQRFVGLPVRQLHPASAAQRRCRYRCPNHRYSRLR